LLCFVFTCMIIVFFCCVMYVFFQYFDTVGWVFWPVKTVARITYILCWRRRQTLLNQSIMQKCQAMLHVNDLLHFIISSRHYTISDPSGAFLAAAVWGGQICIFSFFGVQLSQRGRAPPPLPPLRTSSWTHCYAISVLQQVTYQGWYRSIVWWAIRLSAVECWPCKILQYCSLRLETVFRRFWTSRSRLDTITQTS